MNCGDLDDLRIASDSKGSETAAGVRRHLEECENCRTLDEIWRKGTSDENPPAETIARIQEKLLPGLRAVSPLPSDTLLLAALLSLALTSIAGGTVWLGSAGWRAMASWQLAVDFLLLAGAVMIVARAVIRQMVPAALVPISPSVVLSGVSAVILANFMLLFPFSHDPKFIPHGIECYELVLLTSMASALLFVPLLRYSAWLSPVGQTGMTGFLAGLAGLIVGEIYCPLLDRAHRGLWHFGATLTAALLGTAFGAAARAIRRR